MIGLTRSRAFGLLLALSVIVLIAAITLIRPRADTQAEDGRFLTPALDVDGSPRPDSHTPSTVLAPEPPNTTRAAPREGAAQLPPALAALPGVIPDRDITADEAADAPSTLPKKTGIDNSPALVVDRSHVRQTESAR
jgi:hypothetical protein